jgi:hypothetical protein
VQDSKKEQIKKKIHRFFSKLKYQKNILSYLSGHFSTVGLAG